MRPAKISTNFVPYTDSDFRMATGIILRQMDSNPYFTDPVPPLDVIRELLSAYDAALLLAANKDKAAVARKNKARKILERQLSRLALYVMWIADENIAILLSSGYNLTKDPSPQKIGTLGNVSLRSGANSGELIAKIGAVKGAKSYLFEITNGRANENSVWDDYNSSRCTFTFERLTPGQLYSVRVAALGTGLQKTYSGIVFQWAQ
jgi:hypothetical protein